MVLFEYAIEQVTSGFFPLFSSAKTGGKSVVKCIGTGFLLTEDGHMITAWHNISELSKDESLFYAGNLPNFSREPTQINEVYIDKQSDLYVGHMAISGNHPLRMASVRPDIGASVCMAGYPDTGVVYKSATEINPAQVRKYYIGSLVVDRIKSTGEDSIEGFLCHSERLNGMDGGPVFNTTGHVVGIIISSINRGVALNHNNGFQNSIIQGLDKIIQVMQTAGLNVRLF